MALVEFPNKQGLIVMPFLHGRDMSLSTTTVNAVGESLAFVGQMLLDSGIGTSKVISSAGGKIWFHNNTVTWATAGTTLRVGIQDVNPATGVEDGTYDVFDDLVQGTDTITAASVTQVLMSSGTKTITHGDIVAVVVEMTVRNGTDSIAVSKSLFDANFPYCTQDVGSGPSLNAAGPFCAIQFDDNTIGHFGEWSIPYVGSTPSFGSGSTPDEYAFIFQLPFKCTINGLFARIGAISAGDDAVIALIGTPLTTPTDIFTVTLDPDIQGQFGSSASYSVFNCTETILEANTTYAVSYRPTSANGRIIHLMTLPHADLRRGMLLGTTIQGATRTDLGAFTTSSTAIPGLGFRINKLDSGTAVTAFSAAFVG